MKRILLLSFLFQSFNSFCQYPAESDPHRGIYVDRFAKRLQGASNVYDPNFSILGVDMDRNGLFEKEDALLDYCSENHITTIELYDLEKIFGGSLTAWNENTKMQESLETHLCRFMKKARDQFCITEIGAAGSAAYNFDSVVAFNEQYPVTEPYRLRNDQINSIHFNPGLRIIEQDYPLEDPRRKKAEMLKYALRTADFNSCNPCGARFDNINSEFEFWYNCASDLADFQSLLLAMNSIKQMYNANHPEHQLKIETYLALLTGCSNLTDVISFLDGCNNCAPCSTCNNPHERLSDRILYSQLTGNGQLYSYYVQNQFELPQTGDTTDYHTIQYAGGINTSSSADYLGPWLGQNPLYTIFSAEMYFYNGYRNDPGASFWSPESNNLQPGSTTWFAASHLVGHHDNPMVVQTTGPYCTYNNLVHVVFYYVGPEDPGIDYEFWVTRNSDGTTVYPQGGGVFNGTSTEFIPSTSSTSWHAAIDFADTVLFPQLWLSSGHYTAHLNLNYDHSSGCSYSYTHPVVIEDKPAIEIIGDTAFCQGGYTWLRCSPGAAYQWYKDGAAIPGAVTPLLKVTEDGDYYCDISAWTICDGFTDTVHIHVRKLPLFYLNAFCNGNGTVTLKGNTDAANPNSVNLYGDGGLLYQWNTGAVTDQITVTPGGSRVSYRLVATDPYSGCSRYRDISVPPSPSNSYTASIVVTTPPSGPCASDGVLQAIVTPDPGSVTSFLWSTGETTSIIRNVAPGTYSVAETVWAGACSYYATVSVGTLPADSPVVSAAITNVSCHNTNDGAIQLTLTGGHPPFQFYWRDIPDDTIHDPRTQNQASLFAGTYYVTIYDSGGCEFTRSFFVSAASGSIDITAGPVNPVTQCANDPAGSATVTANGGNAPYNYLWNDSAMQTTATAVNLYAGTYRVTVTDANGCTAVQLVSVPSEVLEVSTSLLDSSHTGLNCDTSADGRLYIDICGGTLPYTLNGSWIYDTVAYLLNLGAGAYPIVITDGNGCMLADTFNVTAPSPVLVNTSTQHASCSGCADGSIQLAYSGGTPPYTTTWIPFNGNLNGTTIENLTAGIYEICITDSSGCMICVEDTILDGQLMITEHHAPYISIIPNPFRQTAVIVINPVPEVCLFRVYDLTGRGMLELKPEQQETAFNRENLTPGIYYYELSGKGVATRKGKIVLY